MPDFKDHFSQQARDYALYRPQYPPELFQYLASRAPSTALAWDCATGSGQAAVSLARHFTQVIATDASADQLAHAEQAENISYRVATAEQSGLETDSADIVSVAQALHWFHFEKFYTEVRRVLKPGGILAVWTYTHSTIAPEIDAVMREFYRNIVSYFPPERKWVDEEYRTVPFPFTFDEPLPEFFMEAAWNLDDVIGYYRSWSAIQRYRKQHGESPLDAVREQLLHVWSQPEIPRSVRWKVHLLLGRVE